LACSAKIARYGFDISPIYLVEWKQQLFSNLVYAKVIRRQLCCSPDVVKQAFGAHFDAVAKHSANHLGEPFEPVQSIPTMFRWHAEFEHHRKHARARQTPLAAGAMAHRGGFGFHHPDLLQRGFRLGLHRPEHPLRSFSRQSAHRAFPLVSETEQRYALSWWRISFVC
jgi:hypothetical protein